jgi:hypothetical protein
LASQILALIYTGIKGEEMKIKKISRGISEDFAKRIAENESLQKIYNKGENEIIWGIRNDYVNLYYNSDSIARISPSLNCKINEYYFTGESSSKVITKTPQEILDSLKTIKGNSKTRETDEKKAQQKLFMLNNSNLESNWYCVDIEYAKAYQNIGERNGAKFSPRFDIIAISKAKPHRVAIIELKYGKGSYVGVSGIKKHIQDFCKFQNEGHYNDLFKQEMINIIVSLKAIGTNVPDCFNGIKVKDFCQKPEFYFITLDNNADDGASAPKQTCGGYLFENNAKWGSKRFSKNNVEKEFGDITLETNEKLYVKFLFSKQTIRNLTINDIIDGAYDKD